MQARIDRYEGTICFVEIGARRKGKTKSVEGKRPNKASSLTHAEEETLWSCGQFGSSTPASLINTIWWQFTQHFGLRGRQEPMKVQDFSFKKDDKGNDFVTFAEGITKTRQSGLHERHRLVYFL